jgi:hypothetical protein
MIRLAGSKCPLCGLQVTDGEPTRSFRPFISNSMSPLLVFSDSTCHVACVRDHPFGDLAVSIEEATRNAYRPDNRICRICSLVISEPADYFGLGFLTDVTGLKASKFNLFQAHLSCLRDWEETPGLVDALRELDASDHWGGDALQDPLRLLNAGDAPTEHSPGPSSA